MTNRKKIFLKVTWPVRKRVPLPMSQDLACKLSRLKLRNDLVRVTSDELCIDGLFGCENRVPDVDRYEIVNCRQGIAIEDHQVAIDGSDISTNPYIDRQASSECDRPTLVIVLESPHRDEYGGSVDMPIAPARGTTGARIHKHLCRMLNSCRQMTCLLSSNVPARVIISNPIPFQTSTYAIHGGRIKKEDSIKLRNFIWSALWDLKGCDSDDNYVFRQEFRSRLDCYCPKAIINACTKGGRRHNKVDRFLRDWRNQPPNRSVQIYNAKHPSIWKSGTMLSLAVDS